MSRLLAAVEALVSADISFILIGGVAAAAHGAVRQTDDVDILYEATSANRERLAAFLTTHEARPKDDYPPELPFGVDARLLKASESLTLTTTLGIIDVFAAIPGIGTYEDALAQDAVVGIALGTGIEMLVLSLDGLIRAKEAANRPKDHLALPELRALRDLAPPRA